MHSPYIQVSDVLCYKPIPIIPISVLKNYISKLKLVYADVNKTLYT
jgi:hypothetical protein